MGEVDPSLSSTDLFMDQKLLQGLPRIRKRVVAWGPGSQTTVLPHSAPRHLGTRSSGAPLGQDTRADPRASEYGGWEIISARMENPGRDERRFGSRSAFVSNVQLKTDADRESCWAESLDDGWLFLFPVHGPSACLISVGAPAPLLIAQSRLIAAQVEAPITSAAEFPRLPADSFRALRIGLAGRAERGCRGVRPAVRRRRGPMRFARLSSRQRSYGLRCRVPTWRACWLTTIHGLMSGFLRHLQMCHHITAPGGTGAF